MTYQNATNFNEQKMFSLLKRFVDGFGINRTHVNTDSSVTNETQQQ